MEVAKDLTARRTRAFRLSLALLAFLGCSYAMQGQPAFMAVDLKSDHLKNPIGIDNAHPRLSWRMEDQRPEARQTAYRIIVGADSVALLNGRGDVRDTGKVVSEQQLVTYAGDALDPFTRYFWRVILWDGSQKESNSAVHSFETGMMGMQNWQGSWISDGRDIDYGPASYFRKEFATAREIASARAYIAVGGLVELYVNGEGVGDQQRHRAHRQFGVEWQTIPAIYTLTTNYN